MTYGWLLLRAEGGKLQHYPSQQAGGKWNSSLLSFSTSAVPWVQGCSRNPLSHTVLSLPFSFLPLQQSHHFAGLTNFALRVWFMFNWCCGFSTAVSFQEQSDDSYTLDSVYSQCTSAKRLLLSILEGSKKCSPDDPNHNHQQKAWTSAYSEKPSWPPPWEHPIPSSFQRDKIHAAVHMDISYVSKQSRSCTEKLREELLKTPSLSVTLKKDHSFLVHLPRKDVSWLVRHWYSTGRFCKFWGVSIIERIKSSWEASYLPPPSHRGSCLRSNSFLFKVRGKETGHHLLISTCIKSPFLEIPSNV